LAFGHPAAEAVKVTEVPLVAGEGGDAETETAEHEVSV
jgi:hypothetical protein